MKTTFVEGAFMQLTPQIEKSDGTASPRTGRDGGVINLEDDTPDAFRYATLPDDQNHESRLI